MPGVVTRTPRGPCRECAAARAPDIEDHCGTRGPGGCHRCRCRGLRGAALAATTDAVHLHTGSTGSPIIPKLTWAPLCQAPIHEHWLTGGFPAAVSCVATDSEGLTDSDSSHSLPWLSAATDSGVAFLHVSYQWPLTRLPGFPWSREAGEGGWAARRQSHQFDR